MVRKDRGVQHVGIRQHQVRLGLDSPPLGGGRVAVEHTGFDPLGKPRIFGEQLGKVLELILGERLGRKKIERSRRGVGQRRFEDWQVVAKRLATGRACHDDHVAPGAHMLHGRNLVQVEPLDAAGRENGIQRRRQRISGLGILARPLRQDFNMLELAIVERFLLNVGEKRGHIHEVAPKRSLGHSIRLFSIGRRVAQAR